MAASVLAGFVGGPLSLDATLATKITLELMHLIVAAAITVQLMRALASLPIVRERSVRGPSEAAA